MILSEQLVCANKWWTVVFFLAAYESEGEEQEYCKDNISHGDSLLCHSFD